MKKNTKLLNNFTIFTKDKKGRKRIANTAKDSQLPRIIYLKMLYGDDHRTYAPTHPAMNMRQCKCLME